MKDLLGDRMKNNYENRTRYMLPRRTYTIIRVDGKAFHTFTKGLPRPICPVLTAAMDLTANALVKEIQGAKFAYTQSDEISVLITDFDNEQTEAWFSGNIQKMTSVAASIATAEFNKNFTIVRDKPALFDARVFTIPDRTEVANYFIWRQKDCVRNSLQMFARTYFSHKDLQNKSSSEIHEMLHSIGLNWAHLPGTFKNGRISGTGLTGEAPNFIIDKTMIP